MKHYRIIWELTLFFTAVGLMLHAIFAVMLR